jgi:branched-chain amino acid transport system permease protein
MKQFLVVGVVSGAVYGLLAVGMVLVYKGARVFNFAQGEFGTVAVYTAWFLNQQHHVSYAVALLGGIAIAALMGFFMERLVVRPLFSAPRITLLVATAGVALGAISLELILAKPQTRSIDPFFGGRGLFGGKGISVAGVILSPQKLIILAGLAALAAGLAYFFSRTDLGLAILATSQEPVATELVGIGTRRMSSLIWTLAGVLGALAGLLLAPTNVFFPGFMTINTLLPAFTAAILGGITSLPGAFVGGQLVGLTQALGDYYSINYLHNSVPGFSNVLLLVLLVAVLTLRPKGLLGSEA